MTEEILEKRIDSLEDQLELLQKKLEIALDALGQIAKFSNNSTDAVQCAVAIHQVYELDG